MLPHAVSTFCRMQFQFWIGKFLIKTQRIAARFYLGYWNQPWFGLAGSENAFIFRTCVSQLSFNDIFVFYSILIFSNLMISQIMSFWSPGTWVQKIECLVSGEQSLLDVKLNRRAGISIMSSAELKMQFLKFSLKIM